MKAFLHESGQPDVTPDDIRGPIPRRWYITFDPEVQLAEGEYSVARYDLTHVKDGEAHYEFRERSVV